VVRRSTIAVAPWVAGIRGPAGGWSRAGSVPTVTDPSADPSPAAPTDTPTPSWFAEARDHLAGGRFGEVDWVAETASTNADLVARALARPGGPEAVLVADHQTAGRGRLERRWEAPPGANLLVSVLVRPAVDASRWPTLTTAAALAAADAVLAVAGVRPGVRWPNDLIVSDGRAPGKLAGVLAEAVVPPGAAPALVVGVGINVAWPPDAEAGAPLAATSLAACTGRVPDRGRVLAAFVSRLDRWLAVWHDDPGALRDAHRSRSITLGRPVRVRVAGGEVVDGLATDVGIDGSIEVSTPDGARSFAAADVEHLRPA
jgi:BirA family biotin operon repressor/biotin-[acetyl-CoA-carboxylase] ligase